MASIKSFVETICSSFGENITEINAIFIPKQSLNKTKYKQFMLKLCGFTFIQNGKSKAVSYEKMNELFDGSVTLYMSESKTRKVIPSSPLQCLKIKTSLSSYTNKDTSDVILYYPSSTSVTSSESAKKIYQSMLDYEAKQNETSIDDDCEFI